MNAPAMALPRRATLLLRMRNLRGVFAGTGFLLLVNFGCIALWQVDLLLWEVPRVGWRGSLPRELHFLLSNLWLTLPPQPFAAAILNLAPPKGLRRVAHVLLAFALCLGWCMCLDPDGLFQAGRNMEPLAAVRYVAAELEPSIGLMLFLLGFFFFRSASRMQDRVVQTQIASATLDAELQRARLQLLRAQIEPHFLFNTLANVRTLARSDVAAAIGLIDHVMQYFAAALPRLRQQEAELAVEMQLVESYLAIFRVRMGARLSYDVTLPRELAAVPVPTMILLTLVENALKHGIHPALEGGMIRVSAAHEGSALVLKVADSGTGLQRQQGCGNGLANVRTRLRIRYGEQASLSLRPAEPRGVVALVRIPAAYAA